MEKIDVYWFIADKLEKVCRDNDLRMEDLVEMLCEHLDDVKKEYVLKTEED